MRHFAKKLTKPFVIIGISLMGLTSIAVSSSDYFEVSKNLDIFATLFKELNTYYVDDIEPSSLMKTGVKSMLESLDPYTNYISESEMEDYRLRTTGKYGGIGAVIRKANDYVVISEPYAGYPADKAGLIAGDKIISVEGESAKGKTTEQLSQMLKGQPGTDVELTVRRLMVDGSYENKTFTITRKQVKIDNVTYSGMVDDHIGYIKLVNFTENAGKEVRNALKNLKDNNDLTRIILDVRGNPGGLLKEAVNVSNVFIEKGQEIVSTKGKIEEWEKTFKTLNKPVDNDIPVAVLVNSGSASASEIVAGSIQDLDRGVVIGRRTFGKGLVQTTRELSYNTKLKVTTAKYYTPSGRCIQAIDYAERADDGSVSKIPDSLKSSFKTVNSGRTVYDGGGIMPDVQVEKEQMSKIARSLLVKNLIFNYATIFHSKHDSIAPPKEFSMTDDQYQDFIDFLSDKNYDYTTKSEKLFEDLTKSAKKEKYYETIKPQLDSLEDRIQHSKKKDLAKHKAEIKEQLEREIASRYYHRKGKVESSFDEDDEIIKAVDLFHNIKRYKDIIDPPAQAQKEE